MAFNLKKALATAVFCSVFITSNAMAKDACATILCLGGSLLGGKGGSQCKKPIQDYFDIRKNKKGKFNPSRTLDARKSFLNQCSSTDVGPDKQRINNAFGRMFRNPGF